MTKPTISALRAREAVLEKHAAAFVEVGIALREIRDGRLYEADGFVSWKAYMASTAKRFDVGKRRADQLIDAATICTDVVGTSGSHQWKERAVRQLRRLPTDAQRKKVVAAIERNAKKAGKPITSKAVQKHVDKAIGPKPKPEPPMLETQVAWWAQRLGNMAREIESVPDDVMASLREKHAREVEHLEDAHDLFGALIDRGHPRRTYVANLADVVDIEAQPALPAATVEAPAPTTATIGTPTDRFFETLHELYERHEELECDFEFDDEGFEELAKVPWSGHIHGISDLFWFLGNIIARRPELMRHGDVVGPIWMLVETLVAKAIEAEYADDRHIDDGWSIFHNCHQRLERAAIEARKFSA